jgi:hypothetical protein
MTDLDMARLRELAAAFGFWPASDRPEHIAARPRYGDCLRTASALSPVAGYRASCSDLRGLRYAGVGWLRMLRLTLGYARAMSGDSVVAISAQPLIGIRPH